MLPWRHVRLMPRTHHGRSYAMFWTSAAKVEGRGSKLQHAVKCAYISQNVTGAFQATYVNAKQAYTTHLSWLSRALQRIWCNQLGSAHGKQQTDASPEHDLR